MYSRLFGKEEAMNNEQEKEVFATDNLVKLAVNIRAIECTLYRLLKVFQDKYDIYTDYYADGFSKRCLSHDSVLFELTFRNKATNKENDFKKAFFYEDILSETDVVANEIARLYREINETLGESNVEGE